MQLLPLGFITIPIVALFAVACGGGQSTTSVDDFEAASSAEHRGGPAASKDHAVGIGEAGGYAGPTVGAAKGFAALAYSAITAVNGPVVTGNLGVSGASVSNITGFDAAPAIRFGTDSSAPNSLRTILTQREVDALVDDIDVRPCNTDYTDGDDGLTGDVTLHPGVTCMNGLQADATLSGRVILDAGGDQNAFFVIRSNFALTVADETSVVLVNGAQGCGVFWLGDQQVTIGRNVAFVGTVIAGVGLAMHAGSTLIGRALARTGDVVLDGNSISIPLYDVSGSAGTCTHSY